MRSVLVLSVLLAGSISQATEIYKCQVQELKVNATGSVSLKNKPDSKEKTKYLVDGKEMTAVQAVQAAMKTTSK